MKSAALRMLLLAPLCLPLTGCVSGMLARKIVTAPNIQEPPSLSKTTAERISETFTQAWRINVGPPEAELAVAVVEPGDYGFNHGLVINERPNGRRQTRISSDWQPQPDSDSKMEPKGTMILLHGFLSFKETMMHWGMFFAQQGYRVVLVDLRGHGESSGAWVTFGATEARDLVQVMDELERRELVTGRVNVLGTSYGAVMALHWAARDPRIKAVVALEPFSDPQKAVAEFARGFPGTSKLAGRFGDATFAAATTRAAKLADFSWADASVMDSIHRLQIPVLLYHGARDTWIAPANSEKLVAAAPPGSRLVLLPDDDHLSLSLRLDPIALDILNWFAHPPASAAVATRKTPTESLQP